jgi:prefoldin subunit 5
MNSIVEKNIAYDSDGDEVIVIKKSVTIKPKVKKDKKVKKVKKSEVIADVLKKVVDNVETLIRDEVRAIPIAVEIPKEIEELPEKFGLEIDSIMEETSVHSEKINEDKKINEDEKSITSVGSNFNTEKEFDDISSHYSEEQDNYDNAYNDFQNDIDDDDEKEAELLKQLEEIKRKKELKKLTGSIEILREKKIDEINADIKNNLKEISSIELQIQGLYDYIETKHDENKSLEASIERVKYGIHDEQLIEEKALAISQQQPAIKEQPTKKQTHKRKEDDNLVATGRGHAKPRDWTELLNDGEFVYHKSKLSEWKFQVFADGTINLIEEVGVTEVMPENAVTTFSKFKFQTAIKEHNKHYYPNRKGDSIKTMFVMRKNEKTGEQKKIALEKL